MRHLCYKYFVPLLASATQVFVRLFLSIHLSQSPTQNTGPAPEVTRAHLEQDALCCFTSNSVTPVYPREARIGHIEGVVKLILVIAPDGSIADLQAVSGDPLLLDSTMKAVRQWRFFIGGFLGKPREIEVPLSFTFKIEDPPKPAYLHLTSGKTIRADEVREFTDGIEYVLGSRTHHLSATSVANIDGCARVTAVLQREKDCIPAGGPSFSVRAIPLLPAVTPSR
jgi:TonB family protein